MLVPKAERPDFPKWIDNTGLSDFITCERKGFYSKVKLIIPEGRNTGFVSGGAFAKGLEVAKTAFYIHGKSVDESLGLGLEALWKDYGDHEPSKNQSAKTWQGMSHAYLYYFDVWPLGDDPCKPAMLAEGRPAIEFSFAIPLEVNHPQTGEPILYTGRCDTIGQFRSSLYIVDEKTTKGIGPHWAAAWSLRGQFLGYTYAARLYGYNVKGAIVRGIAILVTENKHAECIRPYSEHLIETWWNRTNYQVRRMVDCWKRGEWIEDFSHGCDSFGGCPYMRICETANPEAWEAQFITSTWDPLASPDMS